MRPVSRNLTIWRFASLFMALAILFAGWQLTPAFAQSPEEDMAQANTHIQQALTAARAGDLDTAKKAYKTYDDGWFDIEDGVKTKSKETYRAIEQKMGDVSFALSKTPPVASEVITALVALDAQQQAFIKGTAVAATTAASSAATTAAPVATTIAVTAPTASTTTSATPTIASVLALLETARTAQAKGDYPAAAAAIKQFQTDWLDVEGQVKTRSTDDYRQTENDMALAYNLLSQKSADSKAVIERMTNRLEPYQQATSYGIFDASIILLREGLEALLVVVALLTFLKKSGNEEKQPWIWGGVGVGLGFSIVLGVVIQLLFSSLINPSNREIVEGTVGLFAAVMLIYVSYWMHSKSSASSWNRYVKQRSTAALAKGSLFGLALLSFLAIFREGAETVLFFLGMGSGISLGDLLIGLAIGTVALCIIGFLLVVIGLKIPMAPFFLVASILVFYLCFKFVGMGVHALQVGKVVSATTTDLLPENGFFGLFPTWETTIPQLVLLLAAVFVVVYGRVREKIIQKVPTSTPAGVSK